MKLRLTLFLLFCIAVGAYKVHNHFAGWENQFRQSPSLVFYSIRPGMPPAESGLVYERSLQGVILDEVIVSDPAEKEPLIEATKQALTPAPGIGMASCFNPRQAVSTPDRKTIALVCFECGIVRLTTPQKTNWVPINRVARPLFASLIHKYDLKTDPAS